MLRLVKEDRARIAEEAERVRVEKGRLVAKVAEMDALLEKLMEDLELKEEMVREVEGRLAVLSNPAFAVAEEKAPKVTVLSPKGYEPAPEPAVSAAQAEHTPAPAGPKHDEVSLMEPLPEDPVAPETPTADPAAPVALVNLRTLTPIARVSKGPGIMSNIYPEAVDDILRVTRGRWLGIKEVQAELARKYKPSLVSTHIGWMVHNGKLERTGGKAGPSVKWKARESPSAPRAVGQAKLDVPPAPPSAPSQVSTEATEDVREAVLLFKGQADGRRVSRLPSGKVVLVASEAVDMVQDGEIWRVKLDHYDRFAVAHPLEPATSPSMTVVPADDVRERVAREARP